MTELLGTRTSAEEEGKRQRNTERTEKQGTTRAIFTQVNMRNPSTQQHSDIQMGIMARGPSTNYIKF